MFNVKYLWNPTIYINLLIKSYINWIDISQLTYKKVKEAIN